MVDNLGSWAGAEMFCLMSQINLLPWREESQQKQTKEYLIKLGLTSLLAGSLVLIWITYADTTLDHQRDRTLYIGRNLAMLDEKVAEMGELKNKKQEMIARLEVLQHLQSTRFEIVKIFDELVRVLPAGIYIAELDKTDAEVKISGFATSNNLISDLMRNLENSYKYQHPKLIKVTQNQTTHARGSKFDLLIQIEG